MSESNVECCWCGLDTFKSESLPYFKHKCCCIQKEVNKVMARIRVLESKKEKEHIRDELDRQLGELSNLVELHTNLKRDTILQIKRNVSCGNVYGDLKVYQEVATSPTSPTSPH